MTQAMIHQENGVFPAVCPLDCPDTCGLLLHKENGKIVKVTGNPDHPITQEPSVIKSVIWHIGCIIRSACYIRCGG